MKIDFKYSFILYKLITLWKETWVDLSRSFLKDFVIYLLTKWFDYIRFSRAWPSKLKASTVKNPLTHNWQDLNLFNPTLHRGMKSIPLIGYCMLIFGGCAEVADSLTLLRLTSECLARTRGLHEKPPVSIMAKEAILAQKSCFPKRWHWFQLI